MAQKENDFCDDLWKNKQDWGVKRFQLAYYLSFTVLIVSSLSEYYYNGLISNISYKANLAFLYCTFFLFYHISLAFPEKIGQISFIFSEISIMILFYYSFFRDPEHLSIYMTISVLFFVYFQSYLFMKIHYILFFGLKKLFSLLAFSYVSGKLNSEMNSSLITLLFLIPLLMIACMYFEYLQIVEIYQSKKHAQLSLDKIESIVESIPDGIIAINESFKTIFSNSKIKEVINDNNLLEYISNIEYHSKINNSCTRYIIDDISYAFTQSIGYELILGITEHFERFIE